MAGAGFSAGVTHTVYWLQCCHAKDNMRRCDTSITIRYTVTGTDVLMAVALKPLVG